MTHFVMPDPEARRLLRLLESQGRAERFPTTVKQLRRALGSPASSASLAPGDVGAGELATEVMRAAPKPADTSSTARGLDVAVAGSQKER